MFKVKAGTENILCSLFILGYDEIDAYTYTMVFNDLIRKCNEEEINILYKTFNNEEYPCEIEFMKDKPLSQAFLSCVDDYLGGYKLKDDARNINVGPLLRLNNTEYSFGKYMCSTNNILLANFIAQKVDLEKIVVNKIITYGIDNIKNYPKLFCNKEKEIMYKIFGIEKMHNEQEKSARYKLTKRLEDDLK